MKVCTCETSNETREGWVRNPNGGVWCNACLGPVAHLLTMPAARAILCADGVCESESIGPMGEDGDAWSALVAEARARLSQGGTEKS